MCETAEPNKMPQHICKTLLKTIMGTAVLGNELKLAWFYPQYNFYSSPHTGGSISVLSFLPGNKQTSLPVVW